jgi:hypothetical protein
MAKHSSHILEMARKGAEHKCEELKAEIASLVKHFPTLQRERTVNRATLPDSECNSLRCEKTVLLAADIRGR